MFKIARSVAVGALVALLGTGAEATCPPRTSSVTWQVTQTAGIIHSECSAVLGDVWNNVATCSSFSGLIGVVLIVFTGGTCPSGFAGLGGK